MVASDSERTESINFPLVLVLTTQASCFCMVLNARDNVLGLRQYALKLLATHQTIATCVGSKVGNRNHFDHFFNQGCHCLPLPLVQ
jgi:hypothetical protein